MLLLLLLDDDAGVDDVRSFFIFFFKTPSGPMCFAWVHGLEWHLGQREVALKLCCGAALVVTVVALAVGFSALVGFPGCCEVPLDVPPGCFSCFTTTALPSIAESSSSVLFVSDGIG